MSTKSMPTKSMTSKFVRAIVPFCLGGIVMTIAASCGPVYEREGFEREGIEEEREGFEEEEFEED